MTMLIEIIYKILLYSYPERFTLLKIVIFSLSYYSNIITILLLILLSCILYYKYNKLYNFRRKRLSSTENLFTFINRFKITNIYLTSLNVFIYMFSTFLVLLIIRLSSLGTTYTINLQNIFIISYSKIILLIMFIIFTYLLHIFLDLLLFDDIIRLYIYLCKRLYPIFRFIYDNRFFITMKYLGVIRSRLNDITQNMVSQTLINNKDKKRYPNRVKKQLLKTIASYIEKVPILSNSLSYIEKLFLKVDLYINPFLRDLPLIGLLIILLFDISSGNIYYLYYGLFFFLVIKLYSKLVIFIWGLDLGGLDFILHEYFYIGSDMSNILENDNRYKQLSSIRDSQKLNTAEYTALYRIQLKKATILEILDDLTIYLLHGLKRKDVIIEGDPGLLRLNVTRNFIILVFSLLSFYYVYIQCEITVQLFGTTNISFIILGILLICYYKENVMSNMLYRLSILLQAILCLIIYIKRNMILYMKETIWDYGIKITQTISIDEKLDFIYKYIVYTIKYTKGFTMDQKVYLIDVLTNINYKDLITDDITITQLRQYIDSLLPVYQRLETAYINSRIHLCQESVTTSIDVTTISDMTLLIFLSSIVVTCIYMLPPVKMFLDAYIQITNPKFNVVLVLGRNTYKSFKQLLRTNYPDYFDA